MADDKEALEKVIQWHENQAAMWDASDDPLADLKVKQHKTYAKTIRALLSAPATPSEGLVRFNVNDNVRVKVTDAGRKAYRAYHDQLGLNPDDYNLKVGPDGWTEMQLWEVMQYFGHATYNGCDVPFETEIELKALSTPASSRPDRPPQVAELVSQARGLALYYRNERCNGCEGHCFECDTSRMLDRLATALAAQGDRE